MYLKDTDMQDSDDLIHPPQNPIMYAEAEATASEDILPTLPLTIDQTQLNNLTRRMITGD